MKKLIFKYATLALVLLVLGSCRKDDFEGDPATGKGTNLGKIMENSEVKKFFSPFNNIQTVHLFSLRRDMVSESALQATNVVKLTQDASLIAAYNTSHNTNYAEMPANIYSFNNDAGVSKSGNQYSVTFQNGLFAQNFKINIDGSKWTDVSKSYALAFKVTDWGGLTYADGFSDQIIIFFGIKNQYDGVYTISSGTIQRYTAGAPNVGDALNGSLVGNQAVTLSTIDANTVEITGMRWAGNSSGIAGIDNLRARVDAATNQVTMFSLGGPTLTNMAGLTNVYDPATKTFTLNFDWAQTTNKREIKDFVIKYSRSRE